MVTHFLFIFVLFSLNYNEIDWGSLTRPLKGKATPASGAVKPDYGLHTLAYKDPRSPLASRHCAVHGLNGHYLKTWTDEDRGVNWLKDIIPKIAPAARVMYVVLV